MLLILVALAAAEDGLALPPYRPVPPLSGRIVCAGSSTVSNLVNLWADGLTRSHPDLRIEVIGGGTANAPATLASGASHVAPMTRPMTAGECAAYRKARGHDPLAVVVAISMRSPSWCTATIRSPRSAFPRSNASSAPKPHDPAPALTRGDLGLQPWAAKPVRPYAPHPWQGSHGLIQEVVLGGGRYRHGVRTDYGPSDLAQGVGVEKGGVTVVSVLYATKRTHAVPLRLAEGSLAIATPIDCATGRYPLARRLYLSCDRAPGKAVDPLVAEFLRFVLSRDGQQDVVGLGMFPLTGALLGELRQKLE